MRNLESSVNLHLGGTVAFVCLCVFQRNIVIVLTFPFCYWYFLFNEDFFADLLVLFYHSSRQGSCS